MAALEALTAAQTTTINAQAASITALQQTAASQAAKITALSDKLQFVSLNGKQMFITGANLHIVNGVGAQTTNELGNLIIGYNLSRVGYGVLETTSATVRTTSF